MSSAFFMSSAFRTRLQRLAFKIVPPYKSMVVGFADIKQHLSKTAEIQSDQAIQLNGIMQKIDEIKISFHGRQDGLLLPSQYYIRIQRGIYYWLIIPKEFSEFTFFDGDVTSVHPSDEAEKLPVIWGDVCVPLADGSSIRVPRNYHLFEYKGFQIPSHLISLTGGEPEKFEVTALAHISKFQRHVGIEPDMRILDIGCGIGRDAFQLFSFMSDAGEYIGTDVTLDSVKWCQNHITPKYSNFSFHHFDAHSELYNPFGTKTTMDFRLPADDNSVDRIFLSSVFTHILEEEILHYMKEFKRVLKPTGLVYASFFLHSKEALEAAKTKGNTQFSANFDIPLGNGLYANDPTYPRGAVALTDEAARRLIAQAGLRLARPYLKGWWSGLHETPDDGQDVMILGV